MLVLPSGCEPRERHDRTRRRVGARWRDGGVATGSSAHWASRALLDLDEEEEENEEEAEEPPLNELNYEERRRRAIENRVPGAMVRVTVDSTHPLSAGGVRPWLGIIKRDRRSLPGRGRRVRHRPV